MDIPTSVYLNHLNVHYADDPTLSPSSGSPAVASGTLYIYIEAHEHSSVEACPIASVLNNAHNTRIKIARSSSLPLEPLYQRIAPNAILSTGGRADKVGCHPGTREEVIGLIEKFMGARDNGN